MFLKSELTALIQSIKVLNLNFLEVTDFVLHEIHNHPSNEKTPGNPRYAMLFVKKDKNKKFNSLQLPTREEKSQHQEKNYENPTVNNFEKEKSDRDNGMVSDDSDI